MNWSLIQKHPVAVQARNYIHKQTKELKLHYHNLDHVESIYSYLQDTNQDYSEALDWAVLFHDIIYDSAPAKEARSAAMFYTMAIDNDLTLATDQYKEVVKLIRDTELHLVRQNNLNSSAIIRGDLSNLLSVEASDISHPLVVSELQELYGWTNTAIAEASNKFMFGLLLRLGQNILLDQQYKTTYEQLAVTGIYNTIRKNIGSLY